MNTTQQPPKKDVDLAIAAVRHMQAGMSEDEAVHATVKDNPGVSASEVAGALGKYRHFARLYVTL